MGSHENRTLRTGIAVVLYLVSAFLLLFSYAATIEMDNPDVFPGRRGDEGVYGAAACIVVSLAAGAAALWVRRESVIMWIAVVALLAAVARRTSEIFHY